MKGYLEYVDSHCIEAKAMGQRISRSTVQCAPYILAKGRPYTIAKSDSETEHAKTACSPPSMALRIGTSSSIVG